jgi:excisionase family DNA binding protein
MRTQTITEKQFAEVVGLSYGYVKKLRRKGEIKCLRVGRKILYRYPGHVERFLREREQQAAQ